MELSQLLSPLLSLASHPLWPLVCLLLFLVLRSQRRGRWRPADCPVDLSGKTAMVTGANTGIGLHIAQDLARRGARVILACRSEERGRRAEREIRRRTGNGQVHLRLLDTSSMRSVRAFAQRLREEEQRLDILVNNAAASGLQPAVTAEGLELTIATNYLGPFLLTNLLLDLVKKSPAARIINVSSMNHRRGEVNLRQMRGEDVGTASYDQLYNNTKLMNVLFTHELAAQLQHTASSPKTRSRRLAAEDSQPKTRSRRLAAEDSQPKTRSRRLAAEDSQPKTRTSLTGLHLNRAAPFCEPCLYHQFKLPDCPIYLTSHLNCLLNCD
ncbi:retinol dehydrogenase 11-like isoform X1 [Rhinoraja longicauda]